MRIPVVGTGRPTWFVVGVIVASLLVPTAVSAALTTQLVNIVGTSKTKLTSLEHHSYLRRKQLLVALSNTQA